VFAGGVAVLGTRCSTHVTLRKRRYRKAVVAQKAADSKDFDEAFAKIQEAVDLSMNLKYQEPWVGDVTAFPFGPCSRPSTFVCSVKVQSEGAVCRVVCSMQGAVSRSACSVQRA
jgi:hypothetical protein